MTSVQYSVCLVTGQTWWKSLYVGLFIDWPRTSLNTTKYLRTQLSVKQINIDLLCQLIKWSA